ncbi:ABC transporter substrate-binding protein [Gordonia sp. CPCC 206044]|uniref:ABC transporter substrate-binding protein n=1 Tax=Gordonia sp. CPCC 206044 TaxID=3140793 RepID=UPI003AF337BA
MMRLARGLAALALVVGVVVACGGSTSKGDGTLTFAAALAAATMDPDRLSVQQMAVYTAPVYDSLTALGADETVAPRLAESWRFGTDQAGPYLDLVLRPGLRFPDATPLTAHTVSVNIHRSQTMDGSTNRASLAGVQVDEIDTRQVRLRSPRGVGALPRILAGPAGMMISDKAIADDTDLSRKAVGIGPYTLESVAPNRVRYTRTPGYWDHVATADVLEIVYLSDDAKLNAVRSDSVDVTVLPHDMVTAAEKAGYRTERSLGAENYVFSMNTAIEPFSDPRAREAVNMSLDRVSICAGLLKGECEPTGQIMGAGTAAYDHQIGLTRFPYDMDRAKELIAQAGARGAAVDIVTVAGNKIFEQLATVLQQQLDLIGLRARVVPVAPPQVVSRFAVEKSAAIAFGATGNFFDPSESIDRYVLPTGLYNPGHADLDGVAALAADATAATGADTRTALYRKISGSVDPASFLVPVLSPKTAYVIAPRVTGWTTPWAPAFPSFRGVTDGLTTSEKGN